ncbi:TonB-dependent siderophore receptor [Altericroceibacterium endophyticum]|uniref:TonB-dependent siderophore receptor n=1 Tax=Altericroceibacterium endophyticum TaxID=1808508 RepID=A0A6I4TBT5_9SPHN|nr:TonB-dependent siderophore receptor [Altericroceibacterium endophyticum]MXO67195.1 TonB-dependent siderophore receptor [Altericroceibacterium endophyticum]
MSVSRLHGLRNTASLSILALALIVPSTASAEGQPVDSEAETQIIVTAAMPEGVGIGTRLPLTIAETPQTISIIDRDRLDEQHLITLDDVMAVAPGVTVQPGTRLRTAYYSRGFVIDTLNFDGIPTSGWNEAVNTEDMAIYERVELLRGASGLLQGTGSPSGTINLVRKRPGQDLAANATLSAGSWNNFRAEGDVSVPLTRSGDLGVRVVGVAEDRDYYYDVGNRNKVLGYGTVEWNVTPRTVLAATIKWQDVRDDGTYMGVPRYSDGGALDLPRSRYTGADWSERNWNNTQLFAELRHDFGGDWEARLAISRIDGDSDMTYASAYGAVDRETSLGSILYGGSYDFDNRETDLDGYVSGGFDLLGQRHQLLVGANYWDGHTQQVSYSLPGLMTPVDLFVDRPVRAPKPDTRTWAGEQTTDTKQYGGYAVLRLKLAEPLTLIGGGRLSWWETETVRRARIGGPLTPTGQYQVDSEFTPYGGVVWEVGGPFSLYASYSSIFTPQSALSFDGEVIDPMTGNNFEAGLKGSWFADKLNASIALFRIRQKNRAQLDPDHPCAPGSVCAYIAEGEVESKGIDAEVQGELAEGWSIQAGYTYTDTKYLRDRTATGGPSPSEGTDFSTITPHHMVKLWTHYRVPALDRRLGLGAGVNWQSSFYTTSGGVRMTQGSYATVDLRADYAITPRINLGLNASNLFDKRYFRTLGGTAWNNWYGEPRSLMATLRVQY